MCSIFVGPAFLRFPKGRCVGQDGLGNAVVTDSNSGFSESLVRVYLLSLFSFPDIQLPADVRTNCLIRLPFVEQAHKEPGVL